MTAVTARPARVQTEPAVGIDASPRWRAYSELDGLIRGCEGDVMRMEEAFVLRFCARGVIVADAVGEDEQLDVDDFSAQLDDLRAAGRFAGRERLAQRLGELFAGCLP